MSPNLTKMEQWELTKNKKIFAAEFNVNPNNVRAIPKSELVVGLVTVRRKSNKIYEKLIKTNSYKYIVVSDYL